MRYIRNYKANYKIAKWLYPTLIFVAPLVLFWQWIIQGSVLYWGALMLQFWPWHQLVKTSLLDGQWPLWNPLLGNGTPLLANLQSAVFYPPNLIYLLMPVEQALTFSVALHLALAGWLMYAYTRHLGLVPFAAFISALSYMFSGYIVGRSQFVPMVNAAAWFPLLLLLGDNVAQRRKWGDVLLLSVVLAVQLLAGHAQLWFYGVLLLGGYVVFRSWQAAIRKTSDLRDVQPRFRSLLDPILRLALAMGLALLVAAVQIIPTAEFLSQSPRSTGAARYEALTYSFWPWRLLTLIAPDFFGNPARGNYWGYANYWEDHAYMGVMPFVLALLAIGYFFRNRRKISSDKSSRTAPHHSLQVVPFFAALIPISLILAMGWNTPVYLFLFDYVPGFGFFRAPSRLLIGYTVGVSVLAGVGLQTLKISPGARAGWQRLLAVCAAIIIAAFPGGFYLLGRSLTFVAATRRAGILLALTIILFLLQPNRKSRNNRRKIMWQGAVVIFAGVDLAMAAWPLLPMLPPTVFTQPITSAEVLKAQPGYNRYFTDAQFSYETTFNHYFQFKTWGAQTVEDRQQLKETLVPDFGVYAWLPSANNNDPLILNHWQQLTQQLVQAAPAQRNHILSVMGVNYFVDAPAQAIWPVLYSNSQMSVQIVPNALPRAYFVPCAYFVPGNAEAIDRMAAPDFDSRQEVVIIGTNGQNTDFAECKPGEISASVTINEANRHKIQLEVDSSSPGFVVLTDSFYPGWVATVDGQPTEIQRANLAFRAVFVEAGKQSIIFSYRPQSFTFGLWTTSATCLILIVVTVFMYQRKKQ